MVRYYSPVKRRQCYISSFFEKIFVFLKKGFLFIKHSTCIKESIFTYIVSVLIGRSSSGGKRLHSWAESSEFRLEVAVSLATNILS